MEKYLLYVLISSITIASPGPGVLLTLTNSLNYSFRGALPGIAGVSIGMLAVASIAASALGAIVASSIYMLNGIKLAGALYLIWLAVKLIRSKPSFSANPDALADKRLASSRFRQGFLVSFLNPKPIVFFMALFPQFIDANHQFIPQFLLFSSTFCILCFLIHCIYGRFAEAAKIKLSSGSTFSRMNKTGGCIFMLFAAGLIYSAATALTL